MTAFIVMLVSALQYNDKYSSIIVYQQFDLLNNVDHKNYGGRADKVHLHLLPVVVYIGVVGTLGV